MASIEGKHRPNGAVEAPPQCDAAPLAVVPQEGRDAIRAVCPAACFPHEPACTALQCLAADTIRALLDELLAAGWAGTRLEKAWLDAMLWRHIGRLDAASDRMRSPTSGRGVASQDAPAPSGPELERLACRLREALPRLPDGALRYDLGEVLRMLERDIRRHAVPGADARQDRGLANCNQRKPQHHESRRVVPAGADCGLEPGLRAGPGKEAGHGEDRR